MNIKLGGNTQKAVAVMLIAILLLEFGSLTKMQKLWGLAFSGSLPTTPPPATPTPPAKNPLTPSHPGGGILYV